MKGAGLTVKPHAFLANMTCDCQFRSHCRYSTDNSVFLKHGIIKIYKLDAFFIQNKHKTFSHLNRTRNLFCNHIYRHLAAFRHNASSYNYSQSVFWLPMCFWSQILSYMNVKVTFILGSLISKHHSENIRVQHTDRHTYQLFSAKFHSPSDACKFLGWSVLHSKP